jgi:non-canonical (house-cleaning) NTP pyrophosphatase
VVISDGKLTGESRTTTFRLPPGVTRLIDSGFELGDANDHIFREHNSKQKSGAVGLLTGDRIDRTQLYMQAVQLALIPFINPELYDAISR